MAQRFPVEAFFVRIAVVTSVVAAVAASASVLHFHHAHRLADRVMDMPWLFWIWSMALAAMPLALIVAFVDRGPKPEHFEGLTVFAVVFTVLAASRPLIVAFQGLGSDASLADRAPWISLALINLAFGALIVAAAIICARSLRRRSQGMTSN